MSLKVETQPTSAFCFHATANWLDCLTASAARAQKFCKLALKGSTKETTRKHDFGSHWAIRCEWYNIRGERTRNVKLSCSSASLERLVTRGTAVLSKRNKESPVYLRLVRTGKRRSPAFPVTVSHDAKVSRHAQETRGISVARAETDKERSVALSKPLWFSACGRLT